MPEDENQRRLVITRAWVRWSILFVPTMMLIALASVWLDFNLIIAALMIVLAGTLFYQRHVNRRSWNSILWGVHAKGE